MNQQLQGLTDQDKSDIIYLINEAIAVLGSAAAVANRCNVSEATISLISKNKYSAQGEDMWRRIAAALGWRKKGWAIADTTNIKIATQALRDAQNECMFIGICHNAGSGKSTSIARFMEQDKTNNVFKLVCRDWCRREFLTRLRITMGLPALQGIASLDDMLEQIIVFLKSRKGRPLLILDQANSLKPSVYPYLIHIFNEMEDQLGMAIFGTDNLEIEIKRGVQLGRRGYDEVYSRFGRNFIHLFGNTKGDTKKVCAANGITSEALQNTIWEECAPVRKTFLQDGETKDAMIIADGRRIKRAILKHSLLQQLNAA